MDSELVYVGLLYRNKAKLEWYPLLEDKLEQQWSELVKDLKKNGDLDDKKKFIIYYIKDRGIFEIEMKEPGLISGKEFKKVYKKSIAVPM